MEQILGAKEMKLRVLLEQTMPAGEYFESTQEFSAEIEKHPDWSVTLLNGARVWDKNGKAKAVYCQKRQDGYVLSDSSDFSGSLMDLVDLFLKYKP